MKKLILLSALLLLLLPLWGMYRTTFLTVAEDAVAEAVLVNGTDFTSTHVWVSQFEGRKEPIALIEATFDRGVQAGTSATLDLAFEVSIDGGTTWGTTSLFTIQIPTNTTDDGDGLVVYHTMVNLYGVTYIRLASITNNDTVTDLTDINASISF